jgi:hypothetical protein
MARRTSHVLYAITCASASLLMLIFICSRAFVMYAE